MCKWTKLSKSDCQANRLTEYRELKTVMAFENPNFYKNKWVLSFFSLIEQIGKKAVWILNAYKIILPFYIKILVLCSIFTVLANDFPVNAQDLGVRIPIRSVAIPSRSSPIRRSRPVRQVKIQRVIVPVREVRTETRLVKTSNLTVTSESGAKVLLESAMRGVKPIEKEVSKNNPNDRAIEFENLTPGNYTVTVSLDGYKSQETEVEVPAQKTIAINIDLEPFKYELNIDTNITDGEVRFAPANFEKTNPDGSLKTTETGGYCIVPIRKGKAVIKELQEGYYNIDIRPAAVEYQPILTAISVPNEILEKDDDDPNEQQSYRIELEKKISTETFASAWVSEDWYLPQGWKLQGKIKTEGIAGIALPRNEQYRYYTNFEMISDVIMKDGNSIGFALRAVDTKNYYSLQIFGAASTTPFTATGYVVKNDKPTLLFSQRLENFAKTIQANKSFRVIIKGVENKFTITIEDSETGVSNPVGEMIDRDKNFRKGAVGVTGRAKAFSEIGFFTVCANLCR